MPDFELRPDQVADVAFLRSTDRAASWAEPGLGKTRVLLAAAEGKTTVVAPGAIRDTLVWEREAEKIGVAPPKVVSYHEVAKNADGLRHLDCDTLLLDEMHHVKNRKVSWSEPLALLSYRTERVYGGTGTPMPNTPTELWNQWYVMYGHREYDFKHFWPWAKRWFNVGPTRFSKMEVGDRLKGCRCKNPESCQHWEQFWLENIKGRAVLRLRDDVLPDLPALSGADDPLWTPMTPTQRRVYRMLKKDLLALIPEQGIAIEALTDSAAFVKLMQLTTGLGVIDPEADPTFSKSGKLTALAELLSDRQRPVVLAMWYGATAAAVARLCARLKLSTVTMGGRMTGAMKLAARDEFVAGRAQVLIGSISVINEGIDGLQHASDEIVMVERSWTPGKNDQTLRRLHRMGQTRPVTARQLVTPDSADQGQWETLAGKRLTTDTALSRARVESLLY